MADIISEEELVLFYDSSFSKNLELPYEDYTRFDLEEMTPAKEPPLQVQCRDPPSIPWQT